MAVVVGVLAPATHSRGGEQKNDGASIDAKIFLGGD